MTPEPRPLADDREMALRELVNDAYARLVAAQKEYQHFQGALEEYVARFGTEAASTAPLLEQMKNASPIQMARLWARAHAGRIVMKELVGAAFSTGRYETRTKAHRAMWASVTQAKRQGEFTAESAGVLRTREPATP